MKALLLAAVAAAASPSLAHAASPADAVSVETVIVTAAPDPEDPPVVARARQRLAETPGSVAVVAAETYAERFAPTLADMLRDAPGVFAEKKWGGDTRLAIRGSGIGNASHNRGVLLAQDGVPFNEADGYGDFQMIDPLLARYAEVYKGGNALRFGGALLGGAINFVTPTGRDAGAGVRLRLDGGAFGTLRAHAELAGQAGDWDGFGAVTGQTSDGSRQQSEGQQQFAALNVGRQFGAEREVRLIVEGGYVHQQIPGALTLAQALADPAAANPANLSGNYQRDMASVRTALETRWRLSAATTLTAGVYGSWKQLDHPIFQVIDQQSRNWGAFVRVAWEGQALGRRADAFWGLSGRLGDLDGKQWVNLAGSHGAQTAQNRQDAQALDLFGESRLFVTDRLALVAGGSYGHAGRDYRSEALPGVAASFDLTAHATYDWFAPRLGFLWQEAGGAQVYGNLTRSVEPPNFSALAPTAAGFTPLDAQDAWTAEIGARGRQGPLVWDLALYRAELRHELLNYTVNAAQGVPAATFNAGRTLHQGLELGLDWRLARGLRLRQTYAWSDFRFQGDVQYGDGRLPVVPEHLYKAELRYDGPGGWFVAPSVEWAPVGTWVDDANTLKSPAYAVANVNLGWLAPQGLRLFLDIRNLLDRRYVSNVTAITDARRVSTAVFYPGDGRSVFGGVQWAY